jgi:hypothetical protein
MSLLGDQSTLFGDASSPMPILHSFVFFDPFDAKNAGQPTLPDAVKWKVERNPVGQI